MSSTTTTYTTLQNNTTTNNSKNNNDSKLQPHIRLSTTFPLSQSSNTTTKQAPTPNTTTKSHSNITYTKPQSPFLQPKIEKTQLNVFQKLYNLYIFTTPAYLLSPGELVFFNSFILLLSVVLLYYFIYVIPINLIKSVGKMNYYFNLN